MRSSGRRQRRWRRNSTGGATPPAGDAAPPSLFHHIDREKQGEFTEAERLEREVLERRRRIYPAGHPEIAYALQNLGNTLQIQGGYAEAESLNLEALAILRERLGVDHPETLELVNNLGTLKYEKGDLKARRRCSARCSPHGGVHSGTSTPLLCRRSTMWLASSSTSAGTRRPSRCTVRLSHCAGSGWEKRIRTSPSLGGISPSFWPRRETSTKEREHTGRRSRSFRAVLPPDHIYISGSLLAIGAVLIDQGQPAEAEPLLREALARRVEKLGPDDRRTARAQRTLGLCLAALGQRVEAETLLLDSYRTLVSAKNWYHRTLREHTLQDLVALYHSWDRPADAKKYQALLTDGIERAKSASLTP